MKASQVNTLKTVWNRLSRIRATALIVVALIFPSTLYGWNIVCIMSNTQELFESDGKSMKWDTDAHALRGIGKFYMAISELQRVELGEGGKSMVPTSLMSTEKSAVQQAIQLLSDSEAEFDATMKLADEHGLGDEKGRALISQIRGSIVGARETLESGVLPELGFLQSVARTINEAVNHGVTLSINHLEQGMPGHGKGGVKY